MAGRQLVFFPIYSFLGKYKRVATERKGQNLTVVIFNAAKVAMGLDDRAALDQGGLDSGRTTAQIHGAIKYSEGYKYNRTHR